ncbi:MAG: hypothetical protein VB031_09645 [Eubacteriaceae bacterium]|nr:hypothetical protein [Eubacteriaceae bacterium]
MIAGIVLLIITAAALFCLVDAYFMKMGRMFICRTWITAVVSAVSLSGLDGFAGDLSGAVIPAVIICAGSLTALSYAEMRKKRKNSISPETVKESLDSLPDGVCFSTSDGEPLLINSLMEKLNEQATDKELFEEKYFVLGDGRVFDVSRHDLTVGNKPVTEVIACDVTEQHILNQKLQNNKERLEMINERLLLLRKDIKRMTREKETLSAYRQIHDGIGHALLATRVFMDEPEESRDAGDIRMLWGRAIALLKNETAPEKKTDRLEQLEKAAGAVGVTIVYDGALPEEQKLRDLLSDALHTCLTNAVRHASGDMMYVMIEQTDEELLAEITNNGEPPKDEITEGGGLTNLRTAVEYCGGTMEVESQPRFLLRIVFRRGMEKKI